MGICLLGRSVFVAVVDWASSSTGARTGPPPLAAVET